MMIQTADPQLRVSPDKELRMSPRIQRCQEVAIILHEGGVDSPATVALRDLSPTGFSFNFPRPIKPGELCSITLPRAHGQPIVIVSKVANCRRLSDGTFRIGNMFVRTIARASTRRR